MNPPKFAVACPNCGVGLKVGQSDLGTHRDCPKCGTGFVLPNMTEALRLAESKRRANEQFGFICRLCGSRLFALPQQVGRKLKCPDCHTINLIQQPPPKPVAKKIEPGEAYDLALAEESSIDALLSEDLLFGFSCRVCQTMQSVPRAWVGRQLTCPDCGTQLIVPLPPPAATKAKVVAEDPKISLAAAAPIPQQHVVNVDKLMTAAHQKLEAEARKKPKPIKRPFVSGVYSYPFHPLSLIYLTLISFLGALEFVLVRMTMELNAGPESVLGIPLMILASLVAIPMMGVWFGFLLKTIHWTSLGYPGIGESPGFDFFEFLRSALFIINALGVSAMPGLLLGLATQRQLVGFGLMALSIFLLYPFVILSMIDEDSLFVPYSRFIHQTLGSVRKGWVKFYLSALGIYAVIAGTQILALFFPGEYWSYATLVLVNLATMIYFRLIGRLAYVIDRSIPKQKPQRPEFKK